ncbi:hypothetical protein P12x_001520 [Tundrisphaera lichenicola]|uniref:hypothetical protein n=1 Tax=Tundrisphaera lichenicola TaxID=2029860 RepID=UPI003EBFE20F
MHELAKKQAGFNALSRDQWDGFAGHRRKVSALLGAGAERGPTRLCILGAGNSNDLDLPALLDAHREVHLVDLDPEALGRGAERQRVTSSPSLQRHGGIDLTGLLDSIGRWTPFSPISDADLQAMMEWPARRVGLALPGPFDVVGSTCLLSQIIGNASCQLGVSHPRFIEAVRAIRLGHLRLMAQLARPGGQLVLITDVVSSDALPMLTSTPEESLIDLLPKLARRGGLIHGVNPFDLLEVFTRDPVLSSSTTDLKPITPWFWRLHARVYLVWALCCRTRRLGPFQGSS